MKRPSFGTSHLLGRNGIEFVAQTFVHVTRAAQARSLLGVRGIDKIEGGGSYGTAKTFIVSTPPSFDGNAREYGHASLNNSSLSSDITTGVRVLSATINSVMIGSGTHLPCDSIQVMT